MLVVSLVAFVAGAYAHRRGLLPHGLASRVLGSTTPADREARVGYEHRESFFARHGTRHDYVMLGDSLTADAEWRELFPQASIANRGIRNDTAQGVENRLNSVIATGARRAFLMIGINDLLHGVPVEDVLGTHARIVTRLRAAGIEPVLQSTLLAGRSRKGVNGDVVRLNQGLAKFAAEQGLTFLDLNARMEDGDRLSPRFSRDGLHLNGDGYEVWRDLVAPLIE